MAQILLDAHVERNRHLEPLGAGLVSKALRRKGSLCCGGRGLQLASRPCRAHFTDVGTGAGS